MALEKKDSVTIVDNWSRLGFCDGKVQGRIIVIQVPRKRFTDLGISYFILLLPRCEYAGHMKLKNAKRHICGRVG